MLQPLLRLLCCRSAQLCLRLTLCDADSSCSIRLRCYQLSAWLKAGAALYCILLVLRCWQQPWLRRLVSCSCKLS